MIERDLGLHKNKDQPLLQESHKMTKGGAH